MADYVGQAISIGKAKQAKTAPDKDETEGGK